VTDSDSQIEGEDKGYMDRKLDKLIGLEWNVRDVDRE
jgi:hypothetical protein